MSESPVPPGPEARLLIETRSREEDLELVQRALRREPQALEVLIAEFSKVPAIVRAKNRRLGSVLRADEEADVAQEAMAAAWAKLSSFEGRSRLSTWIYGFAATQVLKARQKKGRQRLRSDDGVLESEPAPAPPEDDVMYDARMIRDALDRIDALQADVIRLRHFEELPFETIATRLDLQLSAVKSRYYRGMPKLEQALQSRSRGDL
ncbi:MAG: RNA polymerase sigma factor [Planctomycetota bacterium]